ncbi:phosphoribosyl transferase domain protein [Fusarium beomiforme]|uniref:Phosphoribosyl transferase domain protein n=1 Tax=Fusarium beomiforme TaxID=44412 RepID=A0A9P5AGX5_9HYPO|nr:phosphoribosyl transferase domain protein [Fusarium beomiforme]
MATLNALKTALKQQVNAETPTIPLSPEQYKDGFNFFVQDAGWETYQNFIIPQLSQLLSTFNSLSKISVLEIGPGPKSILKHLSPFLRKKITGYTAFEPSELYAENLQEWLSLMDDESLFPALEAPVVHCEPFGLQSCRDERYNVILFCHSLYGMSHKEKIIRNCFDFLVEKPDDGMVIIFHRNGSLMLDNLVCHRYAIYPTGAITVKDEDEAIDRFAPFVAGSIPRDRRSREAVQAEWRRVCRELTGRDKKYQGHLVFSSPEIMIALTQHAVRLPELTTQVPLVPKPYKVKNRGAKHNNPAAIVRPVNISQIQECVQWALRCRTSLTVLSGGHSGHCLWPNTVAVDMSAFDKVHVDTPYDAEDHCWVVAEAGCKTGEVIREAMFQGVTVPLGSRPSVGAGLWLQGGIGHMARMNGLACDAIRGAVVVSVKTGQVFLVGHVPLHLQPPGAIRPDDEGGLLWALMGAGTNFGIIISVTFESFTAQLFSVSDEIHRLRNDGHAHIMLNTYGSGELNHLRHDCSTDVYLYNDNGRMHLGATFYRCATTTHGLASSTSCGSKKKPKIVNAVELFDTEMYVSKLHGGHGGGKTSSFKRCVFLKDVHLTGANKVLVAALKDSPTPLCYFHMLNGGERVREAAGSTSFGCRDWDLACVITGIWPRDQDGTPAADDVVRWVYQVVDNLLPLSQGVYGADLGPDPRDEALATRAFGPNRRRLIQLKKKFDPKNVLAYACPITQSGLPQKLVVLVTGEHGAGKDYCAWFWGGVLKARGYSSRVDSISESIKREYADATGADIKRLLSSNECDRRYQEEHRESISDYYNCQLKTRPRLAEEHFLAILNRDEVDVLFITGMKEEAPVATLSHLVCGARLLDIWVNACQMIRSFRRWGYNDIREVDDEFTDTNYLPSFTFDNDVADKDDVNAFANEHLLRFMSKDLQSLADMVTSVPDFPRQGIEFRHVLNIAQQKSGLDLCISLLRSHFSGDWANVNAIVTCEASGYVFASPFAKTMGILLVLIGKGNKLPPPKISVDRCSSHISSHILNATDEGRFEMHSNAIGGGDSVVVVDDVLATGETLVAVLKLLIKAGVKEDDVSVMVVAEFPIHRGREKLRENGFGRVAVQSLLVFDGP